MKVLQGSDIIVTNEQKMVCAPICLFCYSRLRETQLTLESLAKNPLASESSLFVFSDGPKPGVEEEVKAVRQYLRTLSGFKSVEIIERQSNIGLANSIIQGVTQVLSRFDQIIVLEDDLILSSGFLRYMNQALSKYKNTPSVLSISGYSYPIQFPSDYHYDVGFGVRASSWGWATWKDRWDAVDWEVKSYNSFRWNLWSRWKFNRGGSDLSMMLDRQMAGKRNSWAVRFCFHQFKHNLLDVYPRRSLVENIGWSEQATHCAGDYRGWKTDLWDDPPHSFLLPDAPFKSLNLIRQFSSFNSLLARAARTLRRNFNSKRPIEGVLP